MTSPKPHRDRSEHGGVALLAVSGDLDQPGGNRVRATLLRVAAGRDQALLDLTGVGFADRGGLDLVATACEELCCCGIGTIVAPSHAVSQLLDRLVWIGRSLDLPVAALPPIDLDEVTVAALDLHAVSSELRPVESRVLRLLDDGLTETEIAFRFQRSARWVDQVATLARRRVRTRDRQPGRLG